MLGMKGKTWVACMAVSCIPMLFNTAQAEPRSADWSAVCSAGNFKGEAGGTYWVDSGNTWVQTTWYKITRSNEQDGGNKANLKTRFTDLNSGQTYKGAESGDDLTQDGARHDINLAKFGLGSSRIHIRHEFVFDKSGADPRCNLNRQIAP